MTSCDQLQYCLNMSLQFNVATIQDLLTLVTALRVKIIFAVEM